MAPLALPRPQALLFDLDGTLLDTADDLGAALNHVLAQQGFKAVSKEVYRPVASDGTMGLLQAGFGPALGQQDLEALKSDFLAHYLDNIATHTRLFDQVEPLLDLLNQLALPWGIVTNKPGWLTEPLVSQFSALAPSVITLSGDSLARRKPHPMQLLVAAEHLGLPRQGIWYIGDAPRDIDAALAAGMPAIVAEWGYIEGLGEVNSWGADAIASTPDVLSREIHNHYI